MVIVTNQPLPAALVGMVQTERLIRFITMKPGYPRPPDFVGLVVEEVEASVAQCCVSQIPRVD